jgi:DNA primase
MGTALTEDQLRQLSPFASRLILALDPDAAGQMATARGREVIERVSKAAAAEVAQEGDWNLDGAERDHRARLTTEFTARGMIRYKSRMGFDIRVAILPEGQDPDDLIRENPDAFADLLDNAVPIVDYVIQSKIAGRDLNDPAVKSQIATEITPLIDDIDDAVERSHYRQRLARLLKVHERTFFPGAPVVKQQNQRKGYAENNRPYQQRLAPGTRTPSVTTTPSSEVFCLAALLRYPRLLYQINRIFAEELTLSALGITLDPEKPAGEQILWPDSFAGELRPTDFAHPEHRMIFAIWQSALENGDDPLTYLRDVLELQLMARVETWLEQSLDGILREVEPVDTNFSERKSHDEALRRLLGLRLKRLDERMQEVEYLIQDADGGGNAGSVKQYSVVINALFKARLIIENAHKNIGKMNLQDAQEKSAASVQS